MIDLPTRDRRAERHEATRAEILDAAWQVAREQGLAGLSLRDVAARVGMRPPSLYWYFAAKHGIYDAMFAAGNRQLLDRLTAEAWPTDPRELLRRRSAEAAASSCTRNKRPLLLCDECRDRGGNADLIPGLR